MPQQYLSYLLPYMILPFGKPRLIYLVSPRGTKTHLAVRKASKGAWIDILSYDEALSRRHLKGATYVFTDMDRLSPPQLRPAAALYRHLRAQGLSVLNDPARAPTRAGLLRMLHEAGINDFNAYRVEEQVRPQRWPVFIRAEGSHTAPVSGLLHTWDEVRQSVDAAIRAGYPAACLIIVEYAAEPVIPGLYRKLASFRFGKAEFAHLCVHDDNWLVKYGKIGIAPRELYADELRIVRDNPHAEIVSRAFDIAGMEYGRVDFGMVNGRVQIYEINSNPTVSFPTEHPAPDRIVSYSLFRRNYLAALEAAASRGRSIRLPRPLIANKHL